MNIKDRIDEANGFLPSGFFQRLIGRLVVWSQDTHGGDISQLGLYQVLQLRLYLFSYYFVEFILC